MKKLLKSDDSKKEARHNERRETFDPFLESVEIEKHEGHGPHGLVIALIESGGEGAF